MDYILSNSLILPINIVISRCGITYTRLKLFDQLYTDNNNNNNKAYFVYFWSILIYNILTTWNTPTAIYFASVYKSTMTLFQLCGILGTTCRHGGRGRPNVYRPLAFSWPQINILAVQNHIVFNEMYWYIMQIDICKGFPVQQIFSNSIIYLHYLCCKIPVSRLTVEVMV